MPQDTYRVTLVHLVTMSVTHNLTIEAGIQHLEAPYQDFAIEREARGVLSRDLFMRGSDCLVTRNTETVKYRKGHRNSTNPCFSSANPNWSYRVWIFGIAVCFCWKEYVVKFGNYLKQIKEKLVLQRARKWKIQFFLLPLGSASLKTRIYLITPYAKWLLSILNRSLGKIFHSKEGAGVSVRGELVWCAIWGYS